MTTNTNAAPTAAVTAPDEREAFEKYMAGSNLNRTPFDDYENNYVHGKWSAWQARAALAATPAAPAAQGDALDAERLDYIGKYRVALIPEFEGGWDAQVYEEDEEPRVITGGMTVRGAIDAARAAKGE